MHLLPHKSWNPWSIKNIEKVQKDEAAAKIDEEKRQAQIDLAEREARFAKIRKRKPDEPLIDDSGEPKSKHINFFEDLEKLEKQQLLGTGERNEDAEKERKEKERKELMQVTSFLGQSAAETMKTKPWYHFDGEAQKTEDQRRKMERSIASADPMNDIKRYVFQTVHPGEQYTGPSTLTGGRNHCFKCGRSGHFARDCETATAARRQMEEAQAALMKEQQELKQKQDEQLKAKDGSEGTEKKYASTDSGSDCQSDSDKSSHRSSSRRRESRTERKERKAAEKIKRKQEKEERKRLEKEAKEVILRKLREERLARERVEHKREVALFPAASPRVPTPHVAANEVRYYNSGFNPELSRQSRR